MHTKLKMFQQRFKNLVYVQQAACEAVATAPPAQPRSHIAKKVLIWHFLVYTSCCGHPCCPALNIGITRQDRTENDVFKVFFQVLQAVLPLFLIEIQKLKKQNLRNFLLFLFVIGQNVLAPLVQKLKLFKCAMVCFFSLLFTCY